MQSVREAFEAADVIAAHGDNPSAFLALNRGNVRFTEPGRTGLVVYRPAGRYLMQFGGPFAPDTDYDALLTGFIDHAAARRRRIVAVQLQRHDAERYARHGFAVNQIGASYAVHLPDFSLRGGRFMRLRNKVSRAFRSGLTVTETGAGQAAREQAARELAQLDRLWLRGKGRHARPLRFLVGEHDGPLQARRRLFVGRIADRPVGYITYSPVYGGRPGWLHDLSRRHPGAPPGVMEAINVTAIEHFTAERVLWLHFGFTPFVGLDPASAVDTEHRWVGRIISYLSRHGERLYPASTQLAYKEKWGPHVVLPEYIAFHRRPRLGAVWRLARVTNAV